MSNSQILIVGDDPGTVAEIEDTLKAMGYAVSAATSSGEDALQEAVETPPNVVIEALTKHRNRLEEIVEERTTELMRTDGQLQRKIIEHKQTEKALEESEKRLRGIFENIIDAYYRADLEGNLIMVSPSGVKLLGYNDPKEIIGKNLARNFYDNPEEREIFLKAFEDSGIVTNYEITLRRKDGTPITGEVNSRLIYDKTGTPIAIEGIFRDITQRKQAEAELEKYHSRLEELVKERTAELEKEINERKRAESEIKFGAQRLQTVIETVGEGITLSNGSGHFEIFNSKMEDITGYTWEEVNHHGDFLTLLYPDPAEHQRALDGIREINQTGGYRDVETTIRTKDGMSKTLLVSSVMMRHQDRDWFLSVYRDITKRKRAEKALRQSEAQYRSLVETSPDAITLTDLEGKILVCNQQTVALHEYKSIEDIIGRNAFELIAPEDLQRAGENLQRTLERGNIKNIEYTLLKKDGTCFSAELSVSVILDAENQPCAFMAITRDITQRKQAEQERRRLEEQLRQSQKMEALGILAGGIAHDFNNLLSTIIGYTELLLNKYIEHGKVRTYLEEISQVCDRATDLIRQILTFSRTEERELKPVHIPSLIREALKMMRATLPKTIEIRQQLDPNCRPILANATQIHQVIINLCTNASHAMKEKGGIVEVDLEEIQYTASSPFIADLKEGLAYLKLTVSDTGCGMTPDVKERIFDPFFTTKEVGEGTGLGLSVVHGIVKNHHGAIAMESQPEQGTAFHLFFPIVESEVQEESTDVDPLERGNEHILIVEDEVALAQYYVITLQELGYRITMTSNGEDALEIFGAHPDQFDIVFTDQVMPKMTGTHLSHELKRLRPDIPIILATGYSETISEEKIKALGIRQFLMKPVKTHTLTKIIREILAGEKSNGVGE